MTKRDIVVSVSNSTGITQQSVYTVIQRLLGVITESLQNGETVELRNFGIFKTVTKNGRRGINPNNPKIKIDIPEKKAVVFRQGRRMMKTVNNS